MSTLALQKNRFVRRIHEGLTTLVGRGTLAAVRRYEGYVRWQGGRGYVLKADIRQYFSQRGP